MIEIGTVIDKRYQIRSMLGSGGFGTVYLAWQLQFERPVALKMLSPKVLEEADGLSRFEREARALSTMQHKNTIAFYGFGVWERAPYMVMEYVEGTSVQQLLDAAQKIAPERAIEIAKQVCLALQCAHTNGIIHRDLKPTNVMIITGSEGEDNVKVIDFGLAKLMPGYGIPAQKLTETGYAVGTSHYMSPEQCMGGSTVDQRSDIYALGCMLYEMLVGKKAFDDQDGHLAVMFQHIHDEPPRLPDASGNSQLEALQTVLDTAMAKDPNHRYADAQQMYEDLLALSQAKYAQLVATGPNRRSSNKAISKSGFKHHKSFYLAIGCFTMAAVLAGVWLFKQPGSHSANSPELYLQADRLYRKWTDHSKVSKDLLPLVNKALTAHRQDLLLTRQQHLTLLRMAQACYIVTHDPAGVQATCTEAISFAQPGDKGGWNDWQHLAMAREMLGDVVGAKSLLGAALTEAGSENDNRARELLTLDLGRVLIKLGDISAARKLLLELIDQASYRETVSTCYCQLGDIEFVDNNFKQAQVYFNKVFDFPNAGLVMVNRELGLLRCELVKQNSDNPKILRSYLERLNKVKPMGQSANEVLLELAIRAKLKETAAVEQILKKALKDETGAWSELALVNQNDIRYCIRALQEAGYEHMASDLRLHLMSKHWKLSVS